MRIYPHEYSKASLILWKTNFQSAAPIVQQAPLFVPYPLESISARTRLSHIWHALWQSVTGFQPNSRETYHNVPWLLPDEFFFSHFYMVISFFTEMRHNFCMQKYIQYNSTRIIWTEWFNSTAKKPLNFTRSNEVPIRKIYGFLQLLT